jgi:hypothetical protein
VNCIAWQALQSHRTPKLQATLAASLADGYEKPNDPLKAACEKTDEKAE